MNPGRVSILCFSEGARDRAALPTLVRRLLGSLPYVDCEGADLPRLHDKAKGNTQKARAAIRAAHRLGCAGAAIVLDRDKPKFADRLDDLKAGRDLAEGDPEGKSVPTALGLAIEKFEAWLLPTTSPAPESIPEPKKLLGANIERLAEIASEVDLNQLAKRCPKGFKPFHEEVNLRLGPLVEKSS